MDGTVIERKELNHRQEMFCRQMARGSTKAAAAKQAGYSRHNASASGCNLMRRPEIQERVAELAEAQIDCDELTIYMIWAGHMNDLAKDNLKSEAKMKIREQLYAMAKAGDVPKVAQDDLNTFLIGFDALCKELTART